MIVVKMRLMLNSLTEHPDPEHCETWSKTYASVVTLRTYASDVRLKTCASVVRMEVVKHILT